MPFADPEQRRAYQREWRRANYVPHPRPKLKGTVASRYWAKLKKRRKEDPELDVAHLNKQRARYALRRHEYRMRARERYYRDEAYRRRAIERASAWKKANGQSRMGLPPSWLVGTVPDVRIAGTTVHIAEVE